MAMGTPQHDDIDQPLSEINVTPLVDVMLVLLIIFIIVAPFLAQSLHVDLPRVTAPANPEPAVATLTLHRNGNIELDGKSVMLGQLDTTLRMRLQRQPEIAIRLEADADAPYQKVAELISAVQNSGIHRLAFATQSPP
jgi:biopolymer transport protein TolR